MRARAAIKILREIRTGENFEGPFMIISHVAQRACFWAPEESTEQILELIFILQ